MLVRSHECVPLGFELPYNQQQDQGQQEEVS